MASLIETKIQKLSGYLWKGLATSTENLAVKNSVHSLTLIRGREPKTIRLPGPPWTAELLNVDWNPKSLWLLDQADRLPIARVVGYM